MFFGGEEAEIAIGHFSGTVDVRTAHHRIAQCFGGVRDGVRLSGGILGVRSVAEKRG